MNWNYRWRTRPDVGQLEHLVDQLRMDIIQLRRDLTNKAGYAAKLELVLRQRTQTIDRLNDKLEQVRAQNRRLDAECEQLVELVRLS
jgi:hypothetical protein